MAWILIWQDFSKSKPWGSKLELGSCKSQSERNTMIVQESNWKKFIAHCRVENLKEFLWINSFKTWFLRDNDKNLQNVSRFPLTLVKKIDDFAQIPWESSWKIHFFHLILYWTLIKEKHTWQSPIRVKNCELFFLNSTKTNNIMGFICLLKI